MIPDIVIGTAITTFFHRVDAGDNKNDAMRQALGEALRFVCTCGEPLTLGTVHHKNAPCETQT